MDIAPPETKGPPPYEETVDQLANCQKHNAEEQKKYQKALEEAREAPVNSIPRASETKVDDNSSENAPESKSQISKSQIAPENISVLKSLGKTLSIGSYAKYTCNGKT